MHTIEPIFKVELKIVSMDMPFLFLIPLLVLIHRPSQLCNFHFNSLQTRYMYILPFYFSCIHMLWNSLSRLTVRVVRCVFEISLTKGHCRPKTKYVPSQILFANNVRFCVWQESDEAAEEGSESFIHGTRWSVSIQQCERTPVWWSALI